MVVVLILATITVTITVFFAGYRLAMLNYERQNLEYLEMLNSYNQPGTPIFDALDREYKYTGNLDKPFTDD